MSFSSLHGTPGKRLTATVLQMCPLSVDDFSCHSHIPTPLPSHYEVLKSRPSYEYYSTKTCTSGAFLIPCSSVAARESTNCFRNFSAFLLSQVCKIFTWIILWGSLANSTMKKFICALQDFPHGRHHVQVLN